MNHTLKMSSITVPATNPILQSSSAFRSPSRVVNGSMLRSIVRNDTKDAEYAEYSTTPSKKDNKNTS